MKNVFRITMCLCLVAFVETCQAQYGADSPSRFFDRFVSQSSTVSPYLGLVTSQQTQSTQQGFIPEGIYQNRVRPQLEQRQQADQQRRQIAQIQTQLNDVKQTFQQRQQNSFGATGHPSRFMLYQQYYPGFARLRR